MSRFAPVLLVLLATACAGGNGDPTPGAGALLPVDDQVPGWQRSGATRVFRGAELYGHINGGSEVFLELGFATLEVQEYRHGEHELAVELYHMSDPAAALGIYLGKCGRETPSPGLADRNTSSEAQLQLVRGPLYLIVNNLSGGPVAGAALPAFAAAVAGGVPASPPVAFLQLLPDAARIPGSERIIRGPFTLQALLTLGEGDVLRLAATGTTAVAADYGNPDDPETLILADYGEVGAASASFAHLLGHLDPLVTVIEQGPDHLELDDWQHRRGSVRVDGSRLTIRLLPLAPNPTES